MYNVPDDCINNPSAPWNEPPEREPENPFWLLENSPSLYVREQAANHILEHALTWFDSITDLLAWAVANPTALPVELREPVKAWAKSCIDNSDITEEPEDEAY